MKFWQRLLLIPALASLPLAGCMTAQRLPAVPSASTLSADPGLGPIRFLVARETASFATEARNSFAKEQAWLQSQGHTGDLPPVSYLAISGGGDNGAFGAGLLNGWTASGTRPEFKVVTGISTGALIAPFAFLGPRYDPVLEQVYTTISGKQIFKKRGVVKGVMGDAMAESRPLANMIASNTDRSLLDAIAAEYAKGRVLLVGTTNLDSLDPVIWNMTAIAASKDPRSLELFRSILLASASIPGAFPPVMIDVTANGQRYQEMHVDGGTMTQVFIYPPSLTSTTIPRITHRKRTLYIIRNSTLRTEWENVPRKTMSIAARAIGSLTTTQGIGDLYRIFATTQRDGIDFRLAMIPSTFGVQRREQFDNNYMRQLYAVGKQMAQAGYPWDKYPPGYETPGLAGSRSTAGVCASQPC